MKCLMRAWEQHEAELRGWFEQTKEWSQEAIQADPVGYLQHTKKQLVMQKTKLDDITRLVPPRVDEAPRLRENMAF